jgi:hypothetical protein
LALSSEAAQKRQERRKAMPVKYLPHQEERRVEVTPRFNGAQCLVCVDVPEIVTKASNDWGARYLRDYLVPLLTDTDLVNAILAALDAEISRKCPEGGISVQFMFHHSGGYVEDKPVPRKRRVIHAELVDRVLLLLARRPGNNRITKIYLASCTSHEFTELVDDAFSISGVSHVITVDSPIALTCGSIMGLGWDDRKNQPTFADQSVRIIVWIKEGNKQIAQVPDKEVGPDERFNPLTNTVEKKPTPPPPGQCPSTNPLRGGSRRDVGFYDTAAAAKAAAIAIANEDATVAAGLKLAEFKCPSPKCQKKTLGPVTVTVTDSYGTRATLAAVMASLFNLSWKYVGVVKYDWTSSAICE